MQKLFDENYTKRMAMLVAAKRRSDERRWEEALEQREAIREDDEYNVDVYQLMTGE